MVSIPYCVLAEDVSEFLDSQEGLQGLAEAFGEASVPVRGFGVQSEAP